MAGDHYTTIRISSEAHRQLNELRDRMIAQGQQAMPASAREAFAQKGITISGVIEAAARALENEMNEMNEMERKPKK